MSTTDPEARGVLLRLGDWIGRALYLLCASKSEPTNDGVVIRRDRILGILLLRESTWRNGVLDGVEAWHFLRGDVRRRVEHAQGTVHGLAREWHGNGVKAIECAYERGVLHGKASAWRRDGTKRFMGEYRTGAKTGEWFYVKRDGSLDRERTGIYVDGLRLSGIKGFNEWLGSP
jgi:antitoxin component YwqK of YwqJK toxin-antitoxin module